MSYVNDVFISYRREGNAWTPWARDTFKRALESCLQRDLGQPATVFMDEQIPVGQDYVDQLAKTLASSKVVVTLLSKDYFSSDWCVHELDLTLERARGTGVIPVLVHDGEVIPDAVDRLQRADFKRYVNPALSHEGALYAEFWRAMLALGPQVARAVEDAPPFDPNWEAHFRGRLTEVYNAHRAGTRVPPTTFVLKASTRPTTPPRLVP